MYHVIHLKGPKPPLNAEFNPDPVNWRIFHAAGLQMGRCFGSKSAYLRFRPDCQFLPNANVFGLRRGKLWWGDLDLSEDKARLLAVARRMGTTLYVLSEMDGRFDNAVQRPRDVVRLALWHTGGPVRIRGLATLCRQQGITADEIARRVGMPDLDLGGLLEPEQIHTSWKKAG